jgi:hypothetical protein
MSFSNYELNAMWNQLLGQQPQEAAKEQISRIFTEQVIKITSPQIEEPPLLCSLSKLVKWSLTATHNSFINRKLARKYLSKYGMLITRDSHVFIAYHNYHLEKIIQKLNLGENLYLFLSNQKSLKPASSPRRINRIPTRGVLIDCKTILEYK